MFDSKKIANEIMETFDSLGREKQKSILSSCGLSFQKKQPLSTNSVYRVQIPTKCNKKIVAQKSARKEKELAHC